MAKKVLILAGGGGHTSIALALAQALKGQAEMRFLIPEGDSLSRELLSGYGSVEELVKGRYPSTSNLYFPFRLAVAFLRSFFMVTREDGVVVSTGSNFCVPPALAAYLMLIPVVNIESRVAIKKPSGTARFLRRFSKETLLQWEEQSGKLGGRVIGPIFPMRRYIDKDLGYVLVTGGTEGHRQLFDAIDGLDLPNVVLQTGRIDPKPYANKHPNWRVFDYSGEFERLVAESHLVVAHQGGGTIFEALLYSKPLIIAFNPDIPRSASFEDMEMLAARINAPLIRDVKSQRLMELIEEARQPEINIGDGRTQAAEVILNILGVK